MHKYLHYKCINVTKDKDFKTNFFIDFYYSVEINKHIIDFWHYKVEVDISYMEFQIPEKHWKYIIKP